MNEKGDFDYTIKNGITPKEALSNMFNKVENDNDVKKIIDFSKKYNLWEDVEFDFQFWIELHLLTINKSISWDGKLNLYIERAEIFTEKNMKYLEKFAIFNKIFINNNRDLMDEIKLYIYIMELFNIDKSKVFSVLMSYNIEYKQQISFSALTNGFLDETKLIASSTKLANKSELSEILVDEKVENKIEIVKGNSNELIIQFTPQIMFNGLINFAKENCVRGSFTGDICIKGLISILKAEINPSAFLYGTYINGWVNLFEDILSMETTFPFAVSFPPKKIFYSYLNKI